MAIPSRRLLGMSAVLLVGCGGEDCPAPGGAWRAMSLLGGPGARDFPAAVWTGSELIVVGGDIAGVRRADGAAYRPEADEWAPIADAPEPLVGVGAVWAGSELIVWAPAPGYAYDPVADSWRSLPEGGPSFAVPRAFWTGDEVIAIDSFGFAGGLYDPVNDRWRALAAPAGADADLAFGGAWTGSELLVWGAQGESLAPVGFRYEPATDRWAEMPTDAAMNGTGVWIGSELFMVGSESLGDLIAARFDPASDGWRDATSACGSEAIVFPATAWTGSVAAFWGGNQRDTDGLRDLASGSLYDPETDRWTPMAAEGAPSPRSQASAFWTGSDVIVWGGLHDSVSALGDGARFTP